MQEELKIAIEAAKKAGEIIENGFEKINKITKKLDKGYVTEIDVAAEKTIIDFLQENSNYSILAEETGKTKGESETYWVIDPLDGTTNFIRRVPFFAISIALVCKNKILVGVILNTISHECFYATDGLGAFKNDEKLSVSNSLKPKGGVLIVNHGYGKENLEDYINNVKKFAHIFSLRTHGATALELCHVAQGSADGFMSSGDELWDYAAGLIIVKEAGGKISDWQNKPWDNSSSKILATNGLIHDEVIKILNSSGV